MKINFVYAVEVSGACNLSKHCTWCAMNRSHRPRGFMSDETVERALHWVSKLNKKPDALALHGFGEPLLHPKFDEIAAKFAELMPITMSTNCTYLDEEWADRLAKVKWAWISLSPWQPENVARAKKLLEERGIYLGYPPGVTHDFAGQATGATGAPSGFCEFLRNGACVIRWNGDIATCCISDRAEDKIGHVTQEPEDVTMRAYSICDTCHLRDG